ncbi:MAG: C10 family peptidase [Bacteroidales bacterium]|nr:C10 family peptidase [Bacteroidales bacterium]
MKRTLTLMLAIITVVAMANPVDKKVAERVAINHYAFYAPSSIHDFTLDGSFTTIYEGLSTYYTFTFTSGGFVMIAADDASIPVLGFSYEAEATTDFINPEAKAWLDNYNRQMVEISNSKLSNTETRPQWDKILNSQMEREILDVNPLLTTTWDQGCYYNALCPVETGAGGGSCNHAWTGCVATTMAQLMKYHAFPSTGIGYHSYTHETYGLQSANFSGTTYNFAAMPNNVTSNNASVATLMYHAGVSVNMQYAADGSGAFSEDVSFALVNFFNYAPSATLKSKTDYPVMADWWALLRNDLDAGLPVYYAGSSTASGGHAWVCDGYRLSDNKFHFNWGWSGSYNGYFAIGALNPGGNNFNDDNRIITGITPGNNPATWLIQNTGFTAASRGIGYVHAASSTVTWATAYDGSGTSATINEFTRTINGGETWTTGQVLGGTTYGLGNICALNENIAYVAVYNGVGNQDNTCGVYKTINGGQSWSHLTGALQGSTSFANNVYFWNEQEGMCHGDVKDGYFEIYTTVNGGTTWQRVPQANITGGTPVTGEGGWTSVIEATGDNSIMFGTNKGKVYISDDRGFHWRVTSTGITPATNGGINLIAFTDPDNGIVAQTQGTVAIKKTSNGGVSWETLTPNGPFLISDLMTVPGSANTYVSSGAAAGGTGVSYSFDGGLNWTYFGGTSSKQFLAGDFYDNTSGYVGGFNENQDNGGMFRMIGELGSAAAGAQIEVTPVEFNLTVNAGEIVSNPLNIGNYGDAALEWTIAIDPVTATWLSVAPTSGSTPVGEVSQPMVSFDASGLTAGDYIAIIVVSNNSINNPTVDIPVHLTVESVVLPAPFNLVATPVENTVNLTWTAPGGGIGITEELIYDDNGNFTGAYSYVGYAMSTHMSPAGPCQVLKLKYYTTLDGGDGSFNAEVYAWDDISGMPSNDLLYEIPAIAIDGDWLEVDVTAANLMVDGDFLVGFGSVNETTFVGYDANLDNGRTWDYDHNGSWASWTEAYLIRAIVQYPDGSVQELTVSKPIESGITYLTKSDRKKSGQAGMSTHSKKSRELMGYNVYRNGSFIAGLVPVTDYSDPDLENGNYSYYVTAVYSEGESAPSNIVEVQITGVGTENLITGDQFDVYPNPAEDVLNVRSTEEINALRLIDAGGNIVYEANSPGTGFTINTSDLKSGLYLLKIDTKNGSSVKKISIR